MREIKFRAMWQGKWFYFTLDEMVDAATVGPVGRSMLLIHLGESKNRCQHTGLKDKNGVEIYEGDILSAGKNITGVMEWHEDKAEFSKFMPMSKFEVIGNIYENPELLEK